MCGKSKFGAALGDGLMMAPGAVTLFCPLTLLSRRSSFPFACSASSRALVVFGELLRGMVQSGTEYRDQYRKLTDALEGSGSASKPTLSLGPDKTASSIGLPWCSSAVQPEVEWRRKVWAPVGVPVDVHYTPSSRKVGSLPMKSFHLVPAYDRAKEAGTVRYLQAPYLTGEMAHGAGIDHRPVSSVSTFSLASDRQAEILAGAEARLFDRSGQTAAWTANRSLRSAPITDVPDPYLTTTNQSYTLRPMADSQQHRLRGFKTSSFVLERSLDSTPARCPTAPLEGGTALHSTRYLGVHDSDGSRKLIEVDTTGAPAATNAWKLPTEPMEPPPLPQPVPYVSSHPSTHTQDTARKVAMSASELADPTATARHVASLREPRQPWPAAAAITLKHRRPCAMDTKYGVPIFNEHKIWNKQAAAAREAAMEQ